MSPWERTLRKQSIVQIFIWESQKYDPAGLIFEWSSSDVLIFDSNRHGSFKDFASKTMQRIAGMKFIPLRTPGGELIPGSGLFVKIKKKAIGTDETSDDSRAHETLFPSVHQLRRQVPSDLEKSFTDDSKDDTREEGISQDESSINDTMESFNDEDSNNGGDLDGQDMSCRSHRFSYPTLLGYSGFLSKETQQLTVIAEVHEDATDNY